MVHRSITGERIQRHQHDDELVTAQLQQRWRPLRPPPVQGGRVQRVRQERLPQEEVGTNVQGKVAEAKVQGGPWLSGDLSQVKTHYSFPFL